jgi:hypothetical protein
MLEQATDGEFDRAIKASVTGPAPAVIGRFLLRPLEEPLRTGHARRGGGGVDEAVGRLRRPGPASARSCASPSIQDATNSGDRIHLLLGQSSRSPCVLPSRRVLAHLWVRVTRHYS